MSLDRIEEQESIQYVPRVLETIMTEKDIKLIEERYKDTDFVLEDFAALKVLTGKKFDDTIRKFGRKETKGVWDEGLITKQDLQELTFYVAEREGKTKEQRDAIISQIRRAAVHTYDTILRFGDDDLGNKAEKSTDITGEGLIKSENEEASETKEATTQVHDGTGLDIKELQAHPQVKEYVLGARAGVRKLLSHELQQQLKTIQEQLPPEVATKLQDMLKHGEILADVITDRQIDNISLSLLENVTEQLHANWDNIEQVVDSFSKQLPKLLAFYQKHQTSLEPLVMRMQEGDMSQGDALQEMSGRISVEDQKFLEDIAVDLDITPALQAMLQSFSEAPGRIANIIQDRVEASLGEVDVAAATNEQLSVAYKEALSLFDDYGTSEAMMHDLLDGGDFNEQVYTTKKVSVEGEQGEISQASLKGIEENITTLQPKVLAMKKKLESQAGLFGFMNDPETMDKLNKFARFMSGGKETNFVSWFKKTALGKLFMGGLALFEIGTGKKLFDFESVEEKETINYITKLYMDNDKEQNGQKNKSARGSDNRHVDDTNISYVRMIDGKTTTVFGKRKSFAESGLPTGEKNPVTPETLSTSLQDVIKEDLNLPMLGSVISRHVVDKNLTTFHQAVHGTNPSEQEKRMLSRDGLMQDYMQEHFANALKTHIGNKKDVNLHEEAVVKIVISDLLGRKKAFQGLDGAVVDARSTTTSVDTTPTPVYPPQITTTINSQQYASEIISTPNFATNNGFSFSQDKIYYKVAQVTPTESGSRKDPQGMIEYDPANKTFTSLRYGGGNPQGEGEGWHIDTTSNFTDRNQTIVEQITASS